MARGFNYDAFGTLLGTAGESLVGSDAYLYRGERYDALTGLYHLRARDYDPELGRFHQIDDFAGFATDPYSLNRYNYAESNPVGNFDPAGRFAVTSLVSAVYALHLKDQYLAELASAGPQFTFDVDEAMGRLVRVDLLLAQGAPLKLKERELWVRSGGGGLLGSWVNESGSAKESELPDPQKDYVGGRGFGAGSDVFFLHQTSGRFRQGWALRQVEQAWGALQQSRLNLNLGPRFPDDPRSQRIAAGDVRLKGARWADAIYADALLQATLRSATSVGCGGVRAHFTPTVEGRRYDATGVDLTAKATTALNGVAGGGPIDWTGSVAPGSPAVFLAAEKVTDLEWHASSDMQSCWEGWTYYLHKGDPGGVVSGYYSANDHFAEVRREASAGSYGMASLHALAGAGDVANIALTTVTLGDIALSGRNLGARQLREPVRGTFAVRAKEAAAVAARSEQTGIRGLSERSGSPRPRGPVLTPDLLEEMARLEAGWGQKMAEIRGSGRIVAMEEMPVPGSPGFIGPVDFVGPRMPVAAGRTADIYAGVKQASQYLKDARVPRKFRKQILESFDVRTISVKQAGDDVFGLRYFDDFGNKADGRYLFETFPATRQSIAVPTLWPGGAPGNQFQYVKQWQVRPGATFLEGLAAPQGPYHPGGQLQRYILNPASDYLP